MLLSVLLSIIPAVLAAPATEVSSGAAPLYRLQNNIAGKYIIKLKSGVRVTAESSALQILGREPELTYNNVFKGFAASMDDETLNKMRNHPDVEYIEEDGVAKIFEYVTQNNTVYGISRISSKSPGGNSYTYDSSAGEGTCVYVIDTGIDDSHPDFEGRAKQLKSWISGSDKDDNGHGTHTSGTVGSKTYGVAKKTKLFGFKVLDSSGNGSDSGVIAAIDEVITDSKNRECPKGVAMNLSLGTNENLQAMNAAVAGALKKGVFVAAAAGNDNADARNTAPAGEPTICTVGGTNSQDAKYSLSNYGPVVDIHAPGENVESTMPGGGTGTMSGTSMACPHVAGLGVYLMALEGLQAGAVCDRIVQLSHKGIITGLPADTANALAFNGNPNAQ